MKMKFRSINIKTKLLGLCIIILLIGIIGMFNSITAVETDDNIVNIEEELPVSRGSRATKIKNHIQLVEPNGNPHDGVFGDGDGYTYFIGSEYSSFRIYLKNIFDEGYMRYVNTTLDRGAGVGSVISIKDPYYNVTYLYADETNSFYYDIKLGNTANIDKYQLELNVIYVLVESSGTTNFNGEITFNIQLSSRIKAENSADKIKLVAFNKYYTSIPLYSGAKNQLIAIADPYSASGTLKNVQLSLNLQPTYPLNSKTVTMDTLDTYSYYNSDFQWILQDAGSLYTPPGAINFNFDVTYELNSQTLSEKQVPVFFEIAETPVVYLENQIEESNIGLTSGGKYISNFEIYQGSTSQMLSLKFKNEGNIDLMDVKVELFTDNAAFFFKSKFYYDENDYAYKRSYGKIIELGDVNVGGSVQKEFSTEVIKNLPPGLYRIPIKYTAKYNRGGLIDVEINMEDVHDDVVASRSTTNEGFTPFVLVNVKEGDDVNDKTEPDILALTSDTLRPGMNNVLLAVELTNLENYRLNNVNAKLSAGGTSPVKKLNAEDRAATEVNAQETEFIMYGANDVYLPNKYTIHFLIDIYDDVSAGQHNVPITFSCLDPFNMERTVTVQLSLNLNPNPPQFLITDATTSDIKPDKNFQLTVKVYNCGGGEGKNVRMMFNGSSNLFSPVDSVQTISSVKQNEVGEFKFDVKANHVEPGNTYASSVYISYEDAIGNEYGFDENAEKQITLRVKEPEPDPWDIDEGLAVVILSLVILFCVLLIGIGRMFLAKRQKAKERLRSQEYEEERQPPPRANANKSERKHRSLRKDAAGRDTMGRAPTPQQQQQPPQQQSSSQVEWETEEPDTGATAPAAPPQTYTTARSPQKRPPARDGPSYPQQQYQQQQYPQQQYPQQQYQQQPPRRSQGPPRRPPKQEVYY
jgi:hypothetical protein